MPKLRVASVHLAIFLVSALDASALVYVSQPRNGIVRTTVDIPVLAPITADMAQVVSFSQADAPPSAARRISAVVGKYTRGRDPGWPGR